MGGSWVGGARGAVDEPRPARAESIGARHAAPYLESSKSYLETSKSKDGGGATAAGCARGTRVRLRRMDRQRANFLKLKNKIADTHKLVQLHLNLKNHCNELTDQREAIQAQYQQLERQTHTAAQWQREQSKILQSAQQAQEVANRNIDALKRQVADLEAILLAERLAHDSATARLRVEVQYAHENKRLTESRGNREVQLREASTQIASEPFITAPRVSTQSRNIATQVASSNIDEEQVTLSKCQKSRSIATQVASSNIHEEQVGLSKRQRTSGECSTIEVANLRSEQVERAIASNWNVSWKMILSCIPANRLVNLLEGEFANHFFSMVGDCRRATVHLPRNMILSIDELATELWDGVTRGRNTEEWVENAIQSVAARLVLGDSREEIRTSILLCHTFSRVCRVKGDKMRILVLAFELVRHRRVIEPIFFATLLNAWSDAFRLTHRGSRAYSPLIEILWWVNMQSPGSCSALKCECNEIMQCFAGPAWTAEIAGGDAWATKIADAALVALKKNASFEATLALELISRVNGWDWARRTIVAPQLEEFCKERRQTRHTEARLRDEGAVRSMVAQLLDRLCVLCPERFL